MLLCFQIRVNFTLVLCIACYHFEFGIAEYDKKYKNDLVPTNSQEYSGQSPDYDDIPF